MGRVDLGAVFLCDLAGFPGEPGPELQGLCWVPSANLGSGEWPIDRFELWSQLALRLLAPLSSASHDPPHIGLTADLAPGARRPAPPPGAHRPLSFRRGSRESRRPAERLRDLFQSGAFIPSPTIELRGVPHDRFSRTWWMPWRYRRNRGYFDETNCKVRTSLAGTNSWPWPRRNGAGSPGSRSSSWNGIFGSSPPSQGQRPPPAARIQSRPPPRPRHRTPPAPALPGGCRGHRRPPSTPHPQRTRHKVPESEIQPLLSRDHDFRSFLAWDVAEPEHQPGFNLEYATAFALLRLGVPSVQRGIRLAPEFGGSRREEGELDLVFN